ncbi:hypothetical protein [Sorangium sp. So ce1335]|uniref:hypothetical protein n=1 Tax=Sorangium sp. So ce1335 TaxID=3133335 RepID=UPI003F62DEFF
MLPASNYGAGMCLKAHGRAVIAGKRTHGKGVGQAICAAEGDARTAAAVRVMLPVGTAVEGVGLRATRASRGAEA